MYVLAKPSVYIRISRNMGLIGIAAQTMRLMMVGGKKRGNARENMGKRLRCSLVSNESHPFRFLHARDREDYADGVLPKLTVRA